jgi:hypothetical protein
LLEEKEQAAIQQQKVQMSSIQNSVGLWAQAT